MIHAIIHKSDQIDRSTCLVYLGWVASASYYMDRWTLKKIPGYSSRIRRMEFVIDG